MGPRRYIEHEKEDLPLRRLVQDTHLWAKVAALWHRERMRVAYEEAGYEGHAARRRANEEALIVARDHGWRGQLADLKHQLADLLDPKVSTLKRRRGETLYWEDVVRDDLRRLLALPGPELRRELYRYLRGEAQRPGGLCGQRGLYKLAYLIGFVPTLEHHERRKAFIGALSEIGHDPEVCDVELYRMIFRLLRPYTLKPFEARVGFSMPDKPHVAPDRSRDYLPRARRFARLRRKLSRRRPQDPYYS